MEPLKRTPKVSVIIPNYNHERFLRRRIESVLGQTFQDFEVILLDDLSTDGSRSILSSYAGDPRVRIELNLINSGSSFKQWNKGIRLAHGEYIWVAESDDYAEESFLERLVAELEAEPRVAFAYCRSWRVLMDDRLDGFADFYLTDLDKQRWSSSYSADGREECRNYLVHRNTVPNASAVLFRKALYEAVGGADESLRLCGDWKLWAALALAGRVVYVSEPLNYFRFHDHSVRSKERTTWLETAESVRVIRWILSRVSMTDVAVRELCDTLSTVWVPGVIATRLPLAMRFGILRNARAIDPRATRKLLRGLFAALRAKWMGSRH
jgi:glycosyltransferase involved in cell wall biosynthesis